MPSPVRNFRLRLKLWLRKRTILRRLPEAILITIVTIVVISNRQLVKVEHDDETMWCFRHSEETKGPEGVKCYKSGYKGKCDAALGYIYRVTE